MDIPRVDRLLVRKPRERGGDRGRPLGDLRPRDPELGLPGHDLAVRVQATADLDEGRWPLGVPAVLVLAHPLDSDRAATDLTRDQRRVAGGVLVAVASVAAGSVEIDHADRALGHAEQCRELPPEPVRRL